MVTIHGEVRRPGQYPLPEGLTAAQLVRMAGGFKRSALLDAADLASYQIKDGEKVVSRRITLNIGRAVENQDSNADVALKTWRHPHDPSAFRLEQYWRIGDVKGRSHVSRNVWHSGRRKIKLRAETCRRMADSPAAPIPRVRSWSVSRFVRWRRRAAMN